MTLFRSEIQIQDLGLLQALDHYEQDCDIFDRGPVKLFSLCVRFNFCNRQERG